MRLIRSVLALAVGFAVCWGFHEQIFHFLTQPLRKARYPDVKFIYTGPVGGLMLYMKMAFFVGIFVAAPYLLYQVWAFIAPGLYAHEKAYAVPFILMGSFFFIGGAAFGHYFLFPITFRFLGAVRRPGHAVPAEGRRVLVLLLVVPARPRPRVPAPGDDLRAVPHRPRHRRAS